MHLKTCLMEYSFYAVWYIPELVIIKLSFACLLFQIQRKLCVLLQDCLPSKNFIPILILLFQNFLLRRSIEVCFSISLTLLGSFFFLVSKLRNILTKKGQALEYTGGIQRKEKQTRDE